MNEVTGRDVAGPVDEDRAADVDWVADRVFAVVLATTVALGMAGVALLLRAMS